MKLKLSFSSLLLASLLFTGCAELFQTKIPMSGTSGGTLSGMLSSEEEISELSTPLQLFASQGKSSTSIDIAWSEVAGAVSYRLERAVVLPNPDGSYTDPDEGLFELLERSVYGTSYTDTILREAGSDGGEYQSRFYYRVSAENPRKKYTSSPFCAPEYGTLLAAPRNARADLGESSDSITVRWDSVENAVSYEVWRTTDSGGAGAARIATVTADRRQCADGIDADEQGIEFYYTVYALNSYGNRSAASPIAMGFALVAGAPSQPQNVRVSDGRGTSTGSISIQWDEVQAVGEVKYYVYRSSSADSSFMLLGDTTSASYTDTKSLKNNIYYYYQVQAAVQDEAGQELKSKFSASGPADGSPAEGFILSPPAALLAEKKAGSNDRLLWTPAIGSPEEQFGYAYEIYGDTEVNGSFTELLATVQAEEPGESGYIEAQVAQNASYYRIRTVRTAQGLKSGLSAVTAPSPFPAESAAATRHANLSGEHPESMRANGSGVYPVKVTWSKPTDDNPAGYHVYRSTSRDSGYRRLTDEPVVGLFYIDEDDTTKAGKIYYYRVLSVNALGQGSMYSGTAEGYGALTHEQYMREYNKTIKSSHKKLTLMHKSNDMDKLGSETKHGAVSGSVSYSASIAGLGADITMRYDSYADFHIDNNAGNGAYFRVTGNTDTSANMSANGSMSGTMTCVGMYPGTVHYGNIEIKGGAAGGGTYGIEPEGFPREEVSWTIGEE